MLDCNKTEHEIECHLMQLVILTATGHGLQTFSAVPRSTSLPPFMAQ